MDRDIYSKIIAKITSLATKINELGKDGVNFLANGNYLSDGVALVNTTTTGYYVCCNLSRPAKDTSYTPTLTSVSLTGIASISAEDIANAVLKEKTANSFIFEVPSTRASTYATCTCHVGYTISGIE